MTACESKKKKLGVIGLAVGFLALAGAFLSPWIQDAIDPPEKPLEEKTIDFANKLASAAKAKLKGEKYVPLTKEQNKKPSRFLVPTIIGLGMMAVGLGLLSLLSSEPRMVGYGAIALGISAAVIQWSIILAGAVIFILLVMAVMSFFGG